MTRISYLTLQKAVHCSRHVMLALLSKS